MAEGLTVALLRELFRNLRAFRSLFESDGVDTLRWDSFEISLWDLETIYEARGLLSARQQQAVEMFLVDNIREVDAAIRMGVSPTNPVAMYATRGLEKLVEWVHDGTIQFSKPPTDHTEPFTVRARCSHCEEEQSFDRRDDLDMRRFLRAVQEHQCDRGSDDGKVASRAASAS